MQTEHTQAQLVDLIRSQLGGGPITAGEYVLRFRPGQARFELPAIARRAPVTPSRAPEGGAPEQRSAGGTIVEDQGAGYVVEGVTSSTSVDWYGTEMSPRALEGMAEQFRRGVDLFPRHGTWMAPVEWNEVLGRTFDAELTRAQVANAADEAEPGFILKIRAKVDKDAPAAAELYRRLDDEQPIGLSIGGWFVEFRFIVNQDDEIERIIIEAVELDHTAVTRAPANPDSTGLKVLRSIMQSVMSGPENAQPDTRSGMGSPDPEVTRTRDLDNRGGMGNDASDHPPSNHHDDAGSPESRSDEMAGNEKILELLGEIKRAQDEDRARLNELEAKLNARTTEQPAEPEQAGNTGEERASESAGAPDLDEIARRAAEAAASAIAARFKAEAAPAEPTESKAESELRARLEALEAQRAQQDEFIADLIGSGRRGVRASGTVEAPDLQYHTERSRSQLDQLVSRAKEVGGANVLCAVVQRNVDSLAIAREINGLMPRGERGREYARARENAPFVLRSVIAAAEQDGLIEAFMRAAG